MSEQTGLNRRAALGSGLASWAIAAAPACASTPSARGAVEVLDRIELVDPGRRTIPTRVYLPGGAGPFPVVIFSHGFGGDLGAFANTARTWAEAGYMVINPTHADSVRNPDPSVPADDRGTMRAIIAARAGGGGREGLVQLLEKPFYLASRLADVAFLAGRLAAGEGIHPALHAKARPGPLGMAGHSYGAYTTEVIAGARLTTASRNPDPALRARFAACMAISGQGAGRMDLTSESFAGVAGPLFSITGSRDFGAAAETPQWRLEPFFQSPPGRKYAALVEGFNHGGFDPAAGTEPADTLRAYQLAFWDAWLRGDAGAQGRLAQAAAASRETDPIWLRTR
ncbi:MAG: hypothetical protein WC068_14695 [Caulobacter sp.]